METLTITPAALVITANNAARLYGDPNPAFTGTIRWNQEWRQTSPRSMQLLQRQPARLEHIQSFLRLATMAQAR